MTDSNQKLLHDTQSELVKSENSLRELKLGYIRKYLIIKNAYNKKHFDKDTYDKELEKLAKQYEFKVRSLAEDVSFHQKQADKIGDRLNALKELNRINKIMSNYQEKAQKKEEPKKPLSELEKMMQRLQSIGAFEHKDFWGAEDRK